MTAGAEAVSVTQGNITGDELQGPAAPPMVNGELLFEHPWQSRTFGMARVLCEAGVFSWDEFRAGLIGTIRVWEDDHNDQAYAYWDLFLATLTRLLAQQQVCPEPELQARQTLLANRPHGHDH